MNISTEELVRILNREFGKPFLPEGFFSATDDGSGGLIIYIGRRDLHIDNSGKVAGAGTELYSKWHIVERSQEEREAMFAKED